MTTRRVPLIYRIVMFVATPFVSWWGRLKVTGAELVDGPGPLLMFANHDSHWDPLVVGLAARGRSSSGRQVCALAKASLWKNPLVGKVLDGMGQIPIQRGRGDADALSTAIERLEGGVCVGVFPEGTISRGEAMRFLSGAGRLALAVPTARVLGVAIHGSTDIVRFPKRPRIRVEFFEPVDGQLREGESAVKITRRIMDEVRGKAPAAAAGRRRRPWRQGPEGLTPD